MSLDSVQFVTITNDHPLFTSVASIMVDVLAPLYGCQNRAIEKISRGVDRTCRALLYNEEIVGLLVYKINPTHEFINHGINSAIEVKTLFLHNSKENSGKRFGSALLSEVLSFANKLGSSVLILTVSEDKPESLKFFLKKGFKVVTTFPEKYQQGVSEYLLKLTI